MKTTGFRVWRGKHRATNRSVRVRRISALTGKLLPFHSQKGRRYAYGLLPPNYPVPAIEHASYEPNLFGAKAWVIARYIAFGSVCGVELVDIIHVEEDDGAFL